MPQQPSRRRRSDAERSRARILEVARKELVAGPSLDMSRLAEAAGVSRSTLYRHFPSGDAVREALSAQAIEEVTAVVRSLAEEERPPLALVRRVIRAIVETSTRYRLDRAPDDELGRAAQALAPELVDLVERLAAFAGLEPRLPRDTARAAAAHLADSALRLPVPEREPNEVADELFTKLTSRLDQGLLVLEPGGKPTTANRSALDALGVARLQPGERLTSPRADAYYEDGSPCSPDDYPVARSVASGDSQPSAVVGHMLGGEMRWFAVEVLTLRRDPAAPPYAIVGVFSDVTAEKQEALRQLRTPGTLGREQPVQIDVARVLDAVPPQFLPDQLVAEARRLVEVPAALYVVDIDGTHLLRLAGAEDFPRRLEAPLALGPELAEAGIPDLRRWLADELPGVVMAAMWLRGRAVGVILAAGGDQHVLDEVARQAAPAMELANGYTDVFDAARRRKEMNPAAEIQQSLLPPRIARLAGGQVACGVLPSYDVGGDWIDYVDNRDGAWLAIADAAGRGPRAGALGGIALAALRAARRNDQGLEEAVATMHETIVDASAEEFYVTALVARWSPVYSVFSWVNAGHPPPLLLREDGSAEELRGEPDLPLGVVLDGERKFRRSYRRLTADDRVVLYTDGISARPTATGLFGLDGIARAARSAAGDSADAIARAIQEQVVAASDKPLRDDAAVIVLAPGPDAKAAA